jgi:hypothetical protein
MANSISDRIAGDRAVSGFFAFIASLPAVAAGVGMLYVGYRILTNPEDMGDASSLVWLAGIALFALLFWIVARWTYAAVRAALTPQRVQAMWLRRFQSEGGGAFRTSRVIDRLSRHGVAALTLQDRDVQLSFEQRRNRLAPMFWVLFIPLALLIAYLVWQGWQTAQADIMDLPPARDLQSGIGQFFGALFALIAVALLFILALIFGVLGAMLLVMLLAAIAGPIGAIFARHRDDFKALPRLLARIQRGKGRRGAAIVRISDANWREAVTASLAAVDVAIIDLSNVSEHVAWEIGEAAKACGASGLVFICVDNDKGGGRLSEAARTAVRTALGRDPGRIVYYPARRGGGETRFARELREHIYTAADLCAAMKG